MQYEHKLKYSKNEDISKNGTSKIFFSIVGIRSSRWSLNVPDDYVWGSVKRDLQIRTTSRVQVIDRYDRRPDVHSQLIENSILRANSCGLTNPFVRLCPMNGKTTDGRTRQSTIETFAKFLPFSSWHLIFFSRRIETCNPNLWSFLSLIIDLKLVAFIPL